LVYEGIKAAGGMKGERNAVEKDKAGVDDIFKGGEVESRIAFNQTIGHGELKFTDKNGHEISETKAMGFIKANAAKGLAAQVLAGEADLEKAFHGQGPNGDKKLSFEMSKGLYRSESANLANIASMAHLGVGDNEFYNNIRAQGIEKGKMAQAHSHEMRKKFGNLLNKNGFDKAVDDYAERDVQTFSGTAKGIHKNLKKNPNIYKENSEYSESSKQQTTNARIKDLGGVNKAVDFDVTSTRTKTAEEKGALSGKLTESLKSLGIAPEEAKKLAESIMEGHREGAELLKAALSKVSDISNYSASSNFAKTDEKIKTAGGIDEAIKFDRDATKIQTAKDLGNIETLNDFINNPEALNKFLSKIKEKDKDIDLSNLEGKTGVDFLKALGASQALYFSGNNSIVSADGKIFQGGITPDGKVGGRITGGLSEVIDDSFSKKEGKKYEGQAREDIHNGIYKLAKFFGADDKTANEIADNIISTWDEYGDVVLGAGLAGAGIEAVKKIYSFVKKRKIPAPNDKPAINPTNKMTNFKTEKITSNTPHSFKDMGGLTGTPEKPSLFENIIDDSKNFVKGVVRDVKGFVTNPRAVMGVMASMIEGTPLNPTPMADEDEMVKKYIYGKPFDLSGIKSHISPITSINMNNPVTPHDVHQSVTSQVQSIQFQQRMAENQEYMRQFVNLGAFGTTVQTAAGELSLSTSRQGTLMIGDYQTNVPVNDFRNYMNTNPDAYQSFIIPILIYS